MSEAKEEKSKEWLLPLKLQEVLGIFVVLAGLFALVSLLTFHPQDLEEVLYRSGPRVVQNKAGPVGAAMGSFLLRNFGLGSYAVVAILCLWGTVLFLGRRIRSGMAKFLAAGLFLFSCSTLAAMLTPRDFAGTSIYLSLTTVSLGGTYGALSAGFLHFHLGSVGSYLALVFLLMVSFWLATEGLIAEEVARAASWVGRKGWPGTTRWLRRKLEGTVSLVRSPARRRRREAVIKKALQQESSQSAGEQEEASLRAALALQEPRVVGMSSEVASDGAVSPGSLVAEPRAPLRLPLSKESATRRTKRRRARRKSSELEAVPLLDLLEEPGEPVRGEAEEEISDRIDVIEEKLRTFGIEVRVVNCERGPVITHYELQPAPGVRVQSIGSLHNDLAMALKAPSVRIVVPIPGRSTVGIEVPNAFRGMVRLKEMLLHPSASRPRKLPLYLGKDAAGEPVILDLAELPHLLIAGTTGSGKSVCLNAIVMSLVMSVPPTELRFILVDPKMVELSQFHELPHLLCPVVTEGGRARSALAWVLGEMDRRYQLLGGAGVRKIESYNQMGEEKLAQRMGERAEENIYPLRLPYLVVLIDEFAEVIMVAPREVEAMITRIAQKSRAVGIHLVMATQRPSVDVTAGLIKANMPARIAFRVISQVDSRSILDRAGAERLLDRGDMLFLAPGVAEPFRLQGTFVSEAEIARVTEFLQATVEVDPSEEFLVGGEETARESLPEARELKDPLYGEAVELVVGAQRGSISLLQSKMGIGYGRAARLINRMAAEGIVGKYKGSKPRDVLVEPEKE